jgi:hypothetical protein
MPDTTRRFALANRSRTLRSNANALMDGLKDNGLKSMVRVSVLHPLDDIDGLFLAHPENRPSMAVNEDMWLSNAEFVLTLAEREYERLDKAIAGYKDPENVIRSIG